MIKVYKLIKDLILEQKKLYKIKKTMLKLN